MNGRPVLARALSCSGRAPLTSYLSNARLSAAGNMHHALTAWSLPPGVTWHVRMAVPGSLREARRAAAAKKAQAGSVFLTWACFRPFLMHVSDPSPPTRGIPCSSECPCPHAVYHVLLSAHASFMLMVPCNPMLCPIHVHRTLGSPNYCLTTAPTRPIR